MRPRTLLVVAGIAVLPAAAYARQAGSQADLVVTFGLFSSRADGSADGASSVTTNPEGLQRWSQLYASPCAIGTTSVDAHAPDLPFAVWRIQGQVNQTGAGTARVRVTWQRLRADGRPVVQAPTTTEVRLTPGVPATLDEITLPDAAGCKANVVRLQARYEARALAPYPGKASGRVGAGAVGQVASTARSVASPGAAAGGVANQPNAFNFVGAGATRGFTGYQRAELWLVHTAPNRPDEVLTTSTIATSTVGDFAFAPLAIRTASGLITVRVTGTVELARDASGVPRLVFGARRRTSFTPSARQPRDGDTSVESGGVASTAVAIPGPDEVLSFEMPPLQGEGTPAVPDTFAIRLRLSPVTTPVAR